MEIMLYQQPSVPLEIDRLIRLQPLTPVLKPNLPQAPAQPSRANHHQSRTIDAYEKLGKIGKGGYGSVFKARNRTTGEVVAIKRVRRDLLAMREVDVLSRYCHPSLVDLKEVFIEGKYVFLVLELADCDLSSLIYENTIHLDENVARVLIFQILQGVAHLHRHRILHRDLKLENLLVIGGPNGAPQIKITDFGLCKRYNAVAGHYSQEVVTLWYRAPELLAGHKLPECSPAIDMWSIGCLMAEFILREPLFPGSTEMDQFFMILDLLESGFEKLRQRIPPCLLSDVGFNLLKQLLDSNPKTRLTAESALSHPWFDADSS